MNIVRTEKLEILPINQPNNQQYSFKEGAQLIQFQIANSPHLLLPNTLRLNGKMRCNLDTSTFSNPVLPGNPNSNRAPKDFHINNRIGVHSCFDTITISSLTGQTLESIKSYGRYLASVLPVVHSRNDYASNLTIGNPFMSSNEGISTNATTMEVEFSISLITGLLNSQDQFSLGSNGMRGLAINLNLAPDNQVIRSSDASASNFFYSLIDLTLTADVLVPDEKGIEALSQPKSGAIEYNSVSHLYSVINSSDANVNLNIGLDKVLSIHSTFNPTTDQNNVTVDSFRTDAIKNATAGVYNSNVELKKVQFNRGGTRFMVDYEIDVEEQQNVPQVDLIRNFTDSIKPNNFKNHSLVSVNTENSLATLTDVVDGQPLQLETANNLFIDSDRKKVFGLGINCDPITRSGVSFKDTDYNLRIQSTLNGQSPNAVNTFVMAKNILQYSPQGFAVVS
jgi:hypothetical protein